MPEKKVYKYGLSVQIIVHQCLAGGLLDILILKSMSMVGIELAFSLAILPVISLSNF
jgi:hypothetical protein